MFYNIKILKADTKKQPRGIAAGLLLISINFLYLSEKITIRFQSFSE